MPRKQILPEAQPVEFVFPLNGIDLSNSFSSQRKGTTPVGQNVRAFEPGTGRTRGGQRPGLSRYINSRVNSTAAIQLIDYTVGAGYSAPDGSSPSSQSGRIVTLVAVAGGTVKISNGTTSWASPTGGSSALASGVAVIRSAQNGQRLYFADGTNWKYYDPSTNTVGTWSASAGSLPVDSSSNKPQLICTWNGRTVLSGLPKDGQNWFMSAIGDATDFNYAVTPPTPTMAVAGNNSPAGKVGDLITCLIPYSDDVLIFGGDHTIWQMTGDPQEGGRLDRISDSIGIAWGDAWCKDPMGTVYFFSNRCGIYSLRPGEMPVRISQAIEELAAVINTGTKLIRMAWNDRMQGLHVFVTAPSSSATERHFFYEARTGAWWTDILGDQALNPVCCCTYDGNAATDRVTLIGSRDGYVRALQQTAVDDDGYAIASSVVLGPILTPSAADMMLMELQPVLGTSAGNVTYSVEGGPTAEGALGNSLQSGSWYAGRNLTTYVQRSAHALWLRMTASSSWSMESIRATIRATGKIRERGA